MRVALHSVIADGQEGGYEEAHVRIPDDLVASFARVGIHEWTIWRSGRHLFHLVDCDDFAEAMRVLQDDPANQRWQAFIGPFVDRFENTAGGVADEAAHMVLGEVWTLSRQAAGPR
ncbi:L-rhamnose mutarotase [Pseudonocardia aurantiaca]|uniref:L-rhamnose mutarotase n=1 Tax=Pseudonocardia aurantiaca TaxID=75290 RepID=A0ABW4FN27_9PSEU